jgi:hypothetical protein
LRRWSVADIPSKGEVEDRGGIVDHLNFLAKRGEGGPCRQGRCSHADSVGGEGWHLYSSYTEIISCGAAHTINADLDATGGGVVGTGNPDLDKAGINS